jgi:hypothetical protein
MVRALLTDLRRATGVARARETAVETRPELCFTVRELDAVVLETVFLDDASLDALVAVVLEATVVLEAAVLDEAAVDGLALCATVFAATVFDLAVFAATEVRGCVGAVCESATQRPATHSIATARQSVIRELRCNFKPIRVLLRGWFVRLFSCRLVRRALLYPCAFLPDRSTKIAVLVFHPSTGRGGVRSTLPATAPIRPSLCIPRSIPPPGHSSEVLSPRLAGPLPPVIRATLSILREFCSRRLQPP